MGLITYRVHNEMECSVAFNRLSYDIFKLLLCFKRQNQNSEWKVSNDSKISTKNLMLRAERLFEIKILANSSTRADFSIKYL